MGGSNLANQQGNYGTQGVAAASNVPGARQAATGWTDKSGNLWLFGGGVSAGGMNDLWKYSAGQWTWVSGSQDAQSFGTYGTQGVATPGNVAGGRISSFGWIDATEISGCSVATVMRRRRVDPSATCGCTSHNEFGVTPLASMPL